MKGHRDMNTPDVSSSDADLLWTLKLNVYIGASYVTGNSSN